MNDVKMLGLGSVARLAPPALTALPGRRPRFRPSTIDFPPPASPKTLPKVSQKFTISLPLPAKPHLEPQPLTKKVYHFFTIFGISQFATIARRPSAGTFPSAYSAYSAHSALNVACRVVLWIGLTLAAGTAAAADLVPITLQSSTNTVARYGKIEFKLQVPASFANPFDPDEVAVDLKLTTPQGRRVSLPAFGCQDYERRRVEGRDWLYPAGLTEWTKPRAV